MNMQETMQPDIRICKSHRLYTLHFTLYTFLSAYLANRQNHKHFAIVIGIAIAGQQYAAVGNLHLLYEQNKCPVHIHKEWVWDAERGDNQRLRDYKNGCILRARQGAVLISPFISSDEVAVRDVALREGLPVIYILDNGLPQGRHYKPAAYLMQPLAAGQLPLLSPWSNYVPDKGRCTRAECTAMNHMAEQLAEEAARRRSGKR